MTTTATKTKATAVAITEDALVLGRSKSHATIRQLIADYRTARNAAKEQDSLGKAIKAVMTMGDTRSIIDHGITLAWVTDVTKAEVDVDAMRLDHPDTVAAYEAAKAAYDALAEGYTQRVYHYTKVDVVK